MYEAIIIDDEKWVIKSLIATISDQEWFEITGEFYNGIAAFDYIKEHKPDLAFIDVQLAGINGLEILQAAKQQNLPTLFIVISGHAEFAYAQKALFNNAISYCLKPFSRNELMDSMQKAYQLLEKRAASAPAAASDNENEFKLPPGINGEFLPPDQIRVNNKLVQNMLDYLNEHYMEDISIQVLSDLTCITPNYTSQLFKKETHFTFSSYLTTMRIYLACNFLLHTDMQIFMIANQVGYKDYFYFTKVFKIVTGYTPSAYRSRFYPKSSEKGEA